MNLLIKLLNLLRKRILVTSRKHYQWPFAAPLDFPRVVHIENTNACPARCVMCSMDSMSRKVGIMDFALFERLIGECAGRAEVREVHLHGFGEPLVDKDLPRKVALAKRLGIPFTYIVTNAFLLTEQGSYELIRAGLDGIKFSFYGMTRETYEKVHRHLNFEKTVQNIERFFQMRDRMKAPNPLVRFQFCPDLAGPEELPLFFQKWRPYLDADRGDLFYTTGLHNWAGGKDYLALRVPEHLRHCVWPFLHMQILWDGRVIPCVFDYNGTVALGDATQDTIEEIWRSPRYESFRGIWRQKRSSSVPICAKCDAPDGIFDPRPVEAALQPTSRQIIPRANLRARRLRLALRDIRWDVKLEFKYRNRVT
jgi:radical SAM protein with 4Fe4S-binding SPASM domain